MNLGNTIQLLIAVFIVYSLGRTFFREDTLTTFLDTWRGIRWWMVPLAFLNIAVVVGVGLPLAKLSPWLGRGWTSWVFGQSVNITLAPVNFIESAQQSWAPGAVWLAPLFSSLFLIFLFILLPLLARSEEEVFRRSHLATFAIIKSSIWFGLVHALVGIPLAFAIALIFPGLVFALTYRRSYNQLVKNGEPPSLALEEALDSPTSLHTLYNSLLIITFIVVSWIPSK